MAGNQQVHPRSKDVERNAGEYENGKPSSPSVSSSSLESEEGGIYPPPSGGQMRVQFPREQDIPTLQIPRYYSPPPKRRKSCCHCLCCTICFLLALVVIIAIACGILYWVSKPKIPEYSVDTIQITDFSINGDLSTNCQFYVNVTARNPDKRIGIYYLDHSLLAVSYSGTELCTGALPVFYQGHKNTTFLDVALIGTGARLTSAMISTLTEQQQQASVPLNLKADVPVKIKLGELKLMKVKLLVRWYLVADKLDADAIVKTEKSKVSVKLWGLRFKIA